MMSLLLAPLPLVPVALAVTFWYWTEVTGLCRQMFSRALKLTRGRMCVSKTHAFVFTNCTHGQAQSVLDTFHQYADTHPCLIIGPRKGQLLDEVVARVAPLRVLELGTSCGYSSVCILRLLGSEGRLVTVERDPVTADKGEEIILVAGFKHLQFQVLTCPSAEAIAGLRNNLGDQDLDLVLMDHNPKQYLPDLLALERRGLLSPGCVLLVNNVNGSAARTFLEHIRVWPECYSVCGQLLGMMEVRWNRASRQDSSD
ncbi:transmembrane O-methyltransferase homolog [Denticeps clupeoides]|uniref:catechol O-methyltransferase n=1 Tax=Denticeps clupeoides TaxID=299321 RepID=A0AAY4BNX1_9TELE|nr:transmembrane O-methyltransferase homolog [Denticeps clupeoides]XP_028815504.1 transmembrane O-methyltransferase homolog [Denticeps clupeoides]XP_028815505.1 transmembrane O-methyltransferase homolog [Denticeps clupeoides]XP_028815506.1 transmembrane O-methyltransferase homolog [Denticeps clupeoides]XP_028815507.1 transmembrane O-methyltransferase homolog [Denticeps clupeoides]